jgi:nicotinamide-nucleotide amidase
MKVEIIVIGSELLASGFRETNSAYLTGQLERIGLPVSVLTRVGDDDQALESVFRSAVSRSNLVIAAGGLGPTEDDLTRRVAARVLGRTLVLNEKVLKLIRERFESQRQTMPPSCEREALLPMGARPLENRLGTSPGLRLEEKGCDIFLLPGVPSELRDIFSRQVVPSLRGRHDGKVIDLRVLRVTGLSEPEVDDRLRELYPDPSGSVRVSLLASPGQIEVQLRGVDRRTARLGDRLDQLADSFARRLGSHCFGSGEDALEAVVGGLLAGHGKTLAAAESCTGGMLAQMVTAVPGSSAVFLGGVVSYSNEAKERLLGVNPLYLKKFGAVSSAVALGMAQGVRQRFGSDIGVSITGIAGPGGGTPEKPVGLVYIALDSGQTVLHQRHLFKGSRGQIRQYASRSALDMVRKQFL